VQIVRRKTRQTQTKTKSSDKMKTQFTLLHKSDLHNPAPVKRDRVAYLFRAARSRRSLQRTGKAFNIADANLCIYPAPTLKLSGFTGFKSARAAKAHARHVCGAA
jgi:hypothetical protein